MKKLVLEEHLKDLENELTLTKTDGKANSSDTRMAVFDCILSQTPTAHIPQQIQQISLRCGVTLKDIPCRTSVEAQELGVIAELWVAETLIENEHSTLGFSATTQEGIVELQVLGMIGKLITGTWIKLFYTSHMDQIEPVDGIQGFKKVLIQLKALKG
ncbi:hypothetical protein LSH36_3334g00000 [Paralvinella palmiformis]|uniref:Uncharacterized protein n=1 Tax=Paralvinella palmiformis TaxID=53620 RepID=A0AAD9IPN4_9ANNE|nr:hypothetical protein LSH36_3334g00000 [Paralvinella palmiformis]